MNIKKNIDDIKNIIPENVKLIAISKTKPVEMLMEAYQAGQRIFGENYVQELVEKQPKLPNDIQWHLVGHLQSNKVKYIIPFVDCIQSVDSKKLLLEIQKQAEKHSRTIKCMFEMSIAEDGSKFGFTETELSSMFDNCNKAEFSNIVFCGLMGMGSLSDNKNITRQEYRNLKNIFTKIKSKHFASDPNFCEISMGMSNDYKIAIEEGSSMIRVGSNIFGTRQYNDK